MAFSAKRGKLADYDFRTAAFDAGLLDRKSALLTLQAVT
jgi:hypothetical protein